MIQLLPAQAPSSDAGLRALIQRRSEMQEQLEALTERRGELAQERLNAIARVDAGARADQKIVDEYSARIDEMGARIVRLERDIEKANEQILDAMNRVTTTSEVVSVPRAPAPPGIPVIQIGGRDTRVIEGRYQMLMLGEALLFILLGVIGWRVLTRRVRRTEMHASPAVGELRTAVDSIAVEVERISENQRYLTKLLTEREEQKLAVGDAPRRT